jgi:hypothetical protein
MLHNHKGECSHENLKYRVSDDRIYCVDCRREWGNLTIVNPAPVQPIPWPEPRYPDPFPWAPEPWKPHWVCEW